MKFIELFNDDMIIDWTKVYSIKEFSKLRHCTDSNNVQYDKRTELLVDIMYKKLEEEYINKNSDKYIIFIASILCLYLGCPIAKGKNKKYNHESEKIVRYLFFDEDFKMRENICSNVRNHTFLANLLDSEYKYRSIITLSCTMSTVYELMLINVCIMMANDDSKSGLEKIKKYIELANKISNILGCYKTQYKFDNYLQKSEVLYNINIIISKEKPKPFKLYILIGGTKDERTTYINNNCKNFAVVLRNKDFNEKVVSLSKEKKNFVVNNDNITRDKRLLVHNLCLGYNPKITYVYFLSTNDKELDFPYSGEYENIVYVETTQLNKNKKLK